MLRVKILIQIQLFRSVGSTLNASTERCLPILNVVLPCRCKAIFLRIGYAVTVDVIVLHSDAAQ
ncbi:hypothetical protein T03_3124 [Trichinella britovi]|uniref:Uncharacterized protein n=1 Tax=Trichinella britovi TaxID=45882 RepID=A0A0V1DD33_TRIBR|nr:hypothetical protein T06_9257 [Trichinella sp. T6]KRY59345.1 hypothetical protein T03_3124 [Trichinella britovi]